MTLSLETLGFGLHPEATRDNSPLFAIESPFRLLNESPFDVFVEQTGDKLHIFDDGLTMHEIVAAGVDMSNRHKWDSLRKLAGRRNVSLSHSGVFESYAPMESAEVAVSNYLRTMFSIDDWIAEQVVSRKSIDTLIEDAKGLFKKWWRTEEVIDKPKVCAVYGEFIEFDFAINDTYIDVISPTKTSSASTIRKLVAAPEVKKTLVVIDDRVDPKTADREKAVISMVSSAILFTRLEENATSSNRAA